MFFNYAFTFAAITQRTLLLFAFLPIFSFVPIYKLSAWLPWMLNLYLAYRILNRNKAAKTSVVGISLLLFSTSWAQETCTYSLQVIINNVEQMEGSLRVCLIGLYLYP